MDTLSIIILTAVINAFVTAAIGGIVLYRIQKKIDNSYFEHQTKFVRNHQKRVETLEALFHKYNDFSNEFSSLCHKVIYKMVTKEKFLLGELRKDTDECEKTLDDLWGFLNNNSIYLPEMTFTEIREIVKKSNNALLISMNFGLLFLDLNLETNAEFFNRSLTSGLEVKQIDKENPDFEKFINDIISEIKKLGKRLETLYKLVADTTTTH